MEIRVVAGDVAHIQTPALIVNLFEGATQPGGATGAVDRALDGAISKLMADGEVKGKRGEMTLVHTFGRLGAARVVVAGLGKEKDFTADTVRRVTAEACRFLRARGVTRLATIAHGTGVAGLATSASGQAIAEGAILGLYRFRHYFSDDEDQRDVTELTIVERDAVRARELEEGVRVGRILAEASAMARDMVNEPANVMTPSRMAEIAQEMSREYALEVEVLDETRMEALGMGALLGVARGSSQPPRLIVLRYWGDQENRSQALGLVGKGITFDSGGISIKPASGMEEMKGDMAGGASVIAAMKALAQLKPVVNVTGVVAATENMPGGSAQRPGDVVRTMSGKTIEVVNTDAEGRLVLADALSYAVKLGVSHIVDIATLTGACVVALGHVCTGVMGNDQALIDRVINAGKATGEKMWQLPIFDEYREQIKSAVADIKNTGGRDAGAITGALLIGQFAADKPWAHLDIAGTAFTSKEDGYVTRGGTGVPVRTLAELALGMARS